MTRFAIWIVIAQLITIGSAAALTSPVKGAATLPSGVTIRAPFPCGVKYRVLCAYGTSCNSWHRNVDEPYRSNDYYALDLVRDESGRGRGKAVTAVAAGVVKYAGWAKNGWAGYGRLVIVEHVFKGTKYQSLYAFLDSIKVKLGQKVSAGATVGALGRSGYGKSTYYRYDTLFFALYRGASIGSGGPYGGRATVPEPLGGAVNITRGTKATAKCSSTTPAGDGGSGSSRDGGSTKSGDGGSTKSGDGGSTKSGDGGSTKSGDGGSTKSGDGSSSSGSDGGVSLDSGANIPPLYYEAGSPTDDDTDPKMQAGGGGGCCSNTPLVPGAPPVSTLLLAGLLWLLRWRSSPRS